MATIKIPEATRRTTLSPIINVSTKRRLDELKETKQKIELQIIQEEMNHNMRAHLVHPTLLHRQHHA